MWLTFTYYKDGNITSIYDRSVIGSTNNFFLILSTIYIFTHARGCAGRDPNALFCPWGRVYNAVKTALSLRYKLFFGGGGFFTAKI